MEKLRNDKDRKEIIEKYSEKAIEKALDNILDDLLLDIQRTLRQDYCIEDWL